MVLSNSLVSLLFLAMCVVMMMSMTVGYVSSMESGLTVRGLLAQKQGDLKSIKASMNQVEILIRADEHYTKTKLNGYVPSKKSTLEELSSILKIVQYEVDILSSMCSDKKGPNCDGKVEVNTSTTAKILKLPKSTPATTNITPSTVVTGSPLTTQATSTNTKISLTPPPITIKKEHIVGAVDSEDIVVDMRLPDGSAAKTCKEYLKSNSTILENGVYYIKPFEDEAEFQVFCDMKNGGFIQFQRRMNGKVDFSRKWKDYADGFGDVKTEYWLGLKRISKFTQKFKTNLRVDLYHGKNKKSYFAKYSEFSVDSEEDKFKLHVSGYSGDSGDSFSSHNNFKFSTIDQDNDTWKDNCAQTFKGGFWYLNCHYANLNGAYLKGSHESYADGIEWYVLTGDYYSLEKVSMAMIEK